MRSYFQLFGFATLFALSTAFYPANDQELIGVWKGSDGQQVGCVGLKATGFAYFIIDKDTMGGEHYLTPEGNVLYMKYEMNTAIQPATIDFIVYEAETHTEMGRVPGIFKITAKNKMNLCLNFDGPERPQFGNDNCITLEKTSQ